MDPLAAIIAMLRPRSLAAKVISGAGNWGVRYSQTDSAGFGLVLAGECFLSVDACSPVRLAAGDFVLMPPVSGFSIFSDPDVELLPMDPAATMGLSELRHGHSEGEAEFKLLGGYFRFEPANAALLSGLLPALIHIQHTDLATKRLINTIELIADEALNDRPGRDLIVDRLAEVMLVEALRFRPGDIGALARPGLLEGLSDPNVGKALRCIHADVARHWTVAGLAREAGLSRSAFSERFAQRVGMPPMEYVIEWRMAVAKDILQRKGSPLEKVAAAIGYESASAFSTAFRRQVGLPPSHFARNMIA